MSDLISRQDAIEELKRWQLEDAYYHIIGKHDKIPVSEAIARLQSIPSTESATKDLIGYIMDINPVEIFDQIERGRLKEWCRTIQTEMQLCLARMK